MDQDTVGQSADGRVTVEGTRFQQEGWARILGWLEAASRPRDRSSCWAVGSPYKLVGATCWH